MRAQPLTLVATCVALTACGVEGAAHPIPSASRAIVGTDAPDEHAVVALKVGDDGLCSGTLIGPRIVATARHCVADADTGAALEPLEVEVVPGFAPTLDSARVGVASIHLAVEAPFDTGAVWSFHGEDLAALVLDEDVEDITPRALLAEEPGDLVGATITLVGFGPNAANAPDSNRTRRAVSVDVDIQSGVLLEARDPVACPGDSGGAALLDDTLIGVISFGPTATTCGDEDALGGDLAVVVNGAWNRRTMFWDAAADAGACVLGMPERCDTLDNDCDGDVDEDACDDEAPPPSCASVRSPVGAWPWLALLLVLAIRRARPSARARVCTLACVLGAGACAPGEDDGGDGASPDEPAPDEPAPSLAEQLTGPAFGRAACTEDEDEHVSFVAINASVDTPTATALGIEGPARVGFIRYDNVYRPSFGCDCGFAHTLELFVAPAGERPPAEPVLERTIDVERGACDAVRDVIVPLDPPLDVPVGFDLFVVRRYEARDEDPDDGLGAFGVCMRGCQSESIEDPSWWGISTAAPYTWVPLGAGGDSNARVRVLARGYPPLDE